MSVQTLSIKQSSEVRGHHSNLYYPERKTVSVWVLGVFISVCYLTSQNIVHLHKPDIWEFNKELIFFLPFVEW